MKKYNYIYLIVNLINRKIYIGKHSTNNLDDNYMGSGILIRSAIKKYGIENFNKTYLAFTDNANSLNRFEKFYIRKYASYNNSIGYNLTWGGDGGRTSGTWTTENTLGENNTFYGKHHTDESNKKNAFAHLGNTYRLGKKHSEETKRKMSENRKGKKHPWQNKPRIKLKWLTPDGEIMYMDRSNARIHHSDWTLITL